MFPVGVLCRCGVLLNRLFVESAYKILEKCVYVSSDSAFGIFPFLLKLIVHPLVFV